MSNPLASDESRFVGTWEYERSDDNTTLIFFSEDGTSNYFGGGTLWEIKDGKLVFTMVQDIMTEVLDYEFSNSDNTLTVTNLEYDKIYVFTRKQ